MFLSIRLQHPCTVYDFYEKIKSEHFTAGTPTIVEGIMNTYIAFTPPPDKTTVVCLGGMRGMQIRYVSAAIMPAQDAQTLGEEILKDHIVGTLAGGLGAAVLGASRLTSKAHKEAKRLVKVTDQELKEIVARLGL